MSLRRAPRLSLLPLGDVHLGCHFMSVYFTDHFIGYVKHCLCEKHVVASLFKNIVCFVCLLMGVFMFTVIVDRSGLKSDILFVSLFLLLVLPHPPPWG